MNRTRPAAAALTAVTLAGLVAAGAHADSPRAGFLVMSPAVGDVDQSHVVIAGTVPCNNDSAGLHIRVSGDSFPKPDALYKSVALAQQDTVDGYWPLDIGTWDEIATTVGATRPLTGSARITVTCFTINGPAAAGSFTGPLVPFRDGGNTFGDPCNGFPDCGGLPTPTSTISPPPPTATPAPTPLTPPPSVIALPAPLARPLTKAQRKRCKVEARWYQAHGWYAPRCR